MPTPGSSEIQTIQSQLSDNDKIRILCIYLSTDKSQTHLTDWDRATHLFGATVPKKFKQQTKKRHEKILSIKTDVASSNSDSNGSPVNETSSSAATPALPNESKKRKSSDEDGARPTPKRASKRASQKPQVKYDEEGSELSFDGLFH